MIYTIIITEGDKMTIISENYKLIFIHIPKCGGSSIEREFEKYCKWGDFVIGSTKNGLKLQKITFNLYGLGKHTKPKDLKSILGEKWCQYKKIAIIRHPRKIIESYYKFGKRRLTEICNNKNVTENTILKHIQERNTKYVPEWMYLQNRGVMIDAIIAQDFNEYLSKVCDERWKEFIHDYVLDEEIDELLHLEDDKGIEAFFKNIVNDDFQLLHENISKSEKLIWNDENLNNFKELISDICSQLGYDFSYS